MIIPSETKTENPKKEHNSTIIFFHGMTQNNNCVSYFDSHMQEKFPHTKFIFPQASRKEWKINGMFNSECSNWYTIEGERDHLFTANPPQTIEEVEKWSKDMKINEVHLKNTVLGVHQIIQTEIDKGIKPENIIIAGYSQGGSAALATGLTFQKPLGGIVSLSSFLPWSSKTYNLINNVSPERKNVPIIFCNGTNDGLVPFWTGEMSAKILKSCGYSKVEFYGYQGQGHSTSCDKELYNFLEKVLPGKVTEEENNSNNFPKPEEPKVEKKPVENKQNNNSPKESPKSSENLKNPPIQTPPTENNNKNPEGNDQKKPSKEENSNKKDDKNYDNWTYEQIVKEIKKIEDDKTISSSEKQAKLEKLKKKLEELEKEKSRNEKKPKSGNKFPTGWVVGGVVLFSLTGLILFLIVKIKTWRKKEPKPPQN